MPLRYKIILILCCTAMLAALYHFTPRSFRFTLERHDAPEIVSFTLTVTPKLFAPPAIAGRVQTVRGVYPIDGRTSFLSMGGDHLTIAAESYKNADGAYRALFAEMDIYTGEAVVTVFDFPGNTVRECYHADLAEAVLVKRLRDRLFGRGTGSIGT